MLETGAGQVRNVFLKVNTDVILFPLTCLGIAPGVTFVHIKCFHELVE
jgi:hypothetical protein